MQRQGLGIVVGVSFKAERNALVQLFSQEFGLIKGYLTVTKENKPWLQNGNLVTFSQVKRLETQLGTLKLLSLEKNFSLLSFTGAFYAKFLNYIALCLSEEFKEEEAQDDFFVASLTLLNGLDKTPWQALGLWEKELLDALGYGLSITEETAHPEAKGQPLHYVSPKTGVAVTEEMGRLYKDKLLTLPKLFGGKSPEMLDVFRLTGHFLRGVIHSKTYDLRDKLIAYGQKTDFKESA